MLIRSTSRVLDMWMNHVFTGFFHPRFHEKQASECAIKPLAHMMMILMGVLINALLYAIVIPKSAKIL